MNAVNATSSIWPLHVIQHAGSGYVLREDFLSLIDRPGEVQELNAWLELHGDRHTCFEKDGKTYLHIGTATIYASAGSRVDYRVLSSLYCRLLVADLCLSGAGQQDSSENQAGEAGRLLEEARKTLDGLVELKVQPGGCRTEKSLLLLEALCSTLHEAWARTAAHLDTVRYETHDRPGQRIADRVATEWGLLPDTTRMQGLQEPGTGEAAGPAEAARQEQPADRA